MSRRVAPQAFAIRMTWSRASYSVSLLDAFSKLIWSMYFSFSPLGEISMMPAPAPCCLFDLSKNIFHELERSGGRCLDFHPLNDEVGEDLCLDYCWVLE